MGALNWFGKIVMINASINIVIIIIIINIIIITVIIIIVIITILSVGCQVIHPLGDVFSRYLVIFPVTVSPFLSEWQHIKG